MGLIPYSFNRETDKGITVLLSVKAAYWGFEFSRDPNDPQKTSMKFNSTLVEGFRAFLQAFAGKTVTGKAP